MLKAPINKILPHTMVDGPGNRTVIFFQGCNIACKYCHNPETQQLCCHCGRCVDACPAGALGLSNGMVLWEEQRCAGCDSCIRICPHHSSPRVREMTVAEVASAVRGNLPFIRGITVSGGECSLYLEFVRELFVQCRQEGLTCLMDCNGTIPIWKDPVMVVCDGVMLDVKAWSDERFLALTGAHNHMVKENLRELARMDKLAELRIVCLDGWVDAEAVISGISNDIPDKVRRKTLLKLIRFRNYGVTGELEAADGPGMVAMAELKAKAKACGFYNIRII